MNRALLLATVSVFALPGLCASAANPPVPIFTGKFHTRGGLNDSRILYSQYSKPTGHAVNSQNFTSGTFSTAYNSQGADDFVVPKNTQWTITEVDVSGVYFQGSGPARSEDVIFYKDNAGEPGSVVKKGMFKKLRGGDETGDLAIQLPGSGLKLEPGTYWVSVIANCSFDGGCGEWGWNSSKKLHGNPAMWRNPGAVDDNCPNWGTIESCLGTGPDLMFDLRGIAQRK